MADADELLDPAVRHLLDDLRAAREAAAAAPEGAEAEAAAERLADLEAAARAQELPAAWLAP